MYTGNLVRSMQQPDARQLPHPSPEHGTTTPDPYPYDHQVAASTGQEYAGTAMPVDQAQGHGMVLDTPAPWEGPADPHDSDAALWWIHDNTEWQDVLAHEHEGTRDRGWVRTTYEPPPFQGASEVRGDTWFDGFSTPFTAAGQADTLKYLRGIDSRPENNPAREGYVHGFRPGQTRMLTPNIDRWLGRAHRVYEVQPLTQRDFLTPVNQPNDSWSPDAPIFPSLAQVVRQYLQTPAMAAEPPVFAPPVVGQAVQDPASSVIDGSVL